MCNDYRNHLPLERLIDEFNRLEWPTVFPEGLPNIEPKDDIRITDRAPIARAGEGGAAMLSMMRWSWPAPSGKPVFNYQSDNRRFPTGRCLVITDGFYEFTVPREAKQKTKDKWLFTMPGTDVFAIAGFWRAGAAKGEDAWTMLTCPPGPDIVPYHDRQVVVLHPDRWRDWLSGTGNEGDLLRPSPAGTLTVERAGAGGGKS